MYEGVHILTIKLDVPIDLMRKKEDHFTKNVPINNTFLRLPTFKAGLSKLILFKYIYISKFILCYYR